MVSAHAAKIALISVSDKTNLISLSQKLISLGFQIVATKGTAKELEKHQIKVIEVAEYTGFPEIMDGRVKTLHPKIYAGLLARANIDDAVLTAHDIKKIRLIVVNLYPFQKTITDPQCTWEKAVEQIDIGGPCMLRAAAKNHAAVTAVVDPNDYSLILEELQQQGDTQLATRQRLAAKVFQHTAAYDSAIANYLTSHTEAEVEVFSPQFNCTLAKKMDLRYGENPHQQAAFYTAVNQTGSLAQAKLLQGKPLSFNNLMDSDAALECVRALNKKRAACVIVKHATPCGAAEADTLQTAYQKAYATDPTSAFGGVIAFNHKLDVNTAQDIISQQFVEVILAPDFSTDALNILANKKNCRVLVCGEVTENYSEKSYHSISGGILIQQLDRLELNENSLQLVTKRAPTTAEIQDLKFAWQVVRFVKSNAIVYAKDHATLGIGAGQTSRVFSVKIAALKAEEAQLNLNKAVMASDAFFPFADGVELAASYGISAIIQPGGSINDAEVISAANKFEIAMVFTGVRHFRH